MSRGQEKGIRGAGLTLCHAGTERGRISLLPLSHSVSSPPKPQFPSLQNGHSNSHFP